jgi:hypothetical protein
MQITLTQAEIEDAIRLYVNTEVQVREGKRIDIDLKATRGDLGYTAVIDIVNEDAPAANEQPSVVPASPAPAAAATAAAPVRTTSTRRTTTAATPAATKAEPAPQPEPEVAQAAEPAQEAAQEPAGEAEAVSGSADTAPAAEAAPARPSLFGGLSKPVNS